MSSNERNLSSCVQDIMFSITVKHTFLKLRKFDSVVLVGVAHRNNPVTQRKIAEEDAIPTLVQLMMHPPSQDIQVK